ncbi:hypothetical protein DLAC_01122 [Tieghemostelium lacteum]|uniref:Polymerase/histidinol phosphatase N-terminal domain-containing protein n=1 Tax=Tieghemostelium lacteum TaxID=361077 RepID=A0A152A7S9_TIELA|nr:hypothetical protein DLAC_01122 [Tieghemostelium lacteum]|eukprot:KYR02290.1 hypothetical protein DLAC_01122 [Tieghemostelium lacteum]
MAVLNKIMIPDKEKVLQRLKWLWLLLVPSLRRLILTVVIATLVSVIGVLIYNSPPSLYTSYELVINWSYDPRVLIPFDSNFTYNILLDSHCHTTYSDGSLTPEQNIQWHIANGYNAMFVTDHNTLSGGIETQKIAREKYNDQIKVLVGYEWSNCRVHLNFIGINESITPIQDPTDEEIQDAINQAHQQGGIVVYNHRPWSYWANLGQPTVQQFASWGVDYFDIANTYYFDMQTFLYARENGFGITTANDFHGGTQATGWTLLNKENVTNYNSSAPINASYFTEEDLFQLFKQKKTSFLYQVTGSGYDVGSKLTKNPKYNFYSPWIKVGSFFHSFYSLQRGAASFVNGGSCGSQTVTIDESAIKSCVLWFVVLFLLGEIFRSIIMFIVKYIKMKRAQRAQSSRTIKEWQEDFGVVDQPLLNLEL